MRPLYQKSPRLANGLFFGGSPIFFGANEASPRLAGAHVSAAPEKLVNIQALGLADAHGRICVIHRRVFRWLETTEAIATPWEGFFVHVEQIKHVRNADLYMFCMFYMDIQKRFCNRRDGVGVASSNCRDKRGPVRRHWLLDDDHHPGRFHVENDIAVNDRHALHPLRRTVGERDRRTGKLSAGRERVVAALRAYAFRR